MRTTLSLTGKRAMQRLWDDAAAEYHRRILAALPTGPRLRLLDVGCDDGAWTAELVRRMGIAPGQVAGMEIVGDRRALAQARGYDVRAADLEQRWPFDDAGFDVVHANQVIEHVKRLDHFVQEIHRVLVPNGVAVICTENLASWHNVAALALGYMPFSLTNVSARGPVGNPFALHAGCEVVAFDAHQSDEAWQHIHVLTLHGLRDVFAMNGFSVERDFAAGYHPAPGRLAAALARLHPRHAHFIGIVARRR